MNRKKENQTFLQNPLPPLTWTVKLCLILPVLSLQLFDITLSVPSVAEHSTTVVIGKSENNSQIHNTDTPMY